MGWTVAEGDRFSGSTPHPRDHPPSGPASVVTSTRLRGFFWCRGASNRPAGATRPRPGATPAHAPRPTVSSSPTGAGHGTRASRKRSRPSSSTAAPASHGRRWPTSSAPPGTALVPAASGHARAPTGSTRPPPPRLGWAWVGRGRLRACMRRIRISQRWSAPSRSSNSGIWTR